jgi:hypothetical protein
MQTYLVHGSCAGVGSNTSFKALPLACLHQLRYMDVWLLTL